MSLAELEARVKRELDFVSYPTRAWMRPAQQDVYDVIIVGGGQSGLAAAFGLLREREKCVGIGAAVLVHAGLL